jgi:hypothetical protein
VDTEGPLHESLAATFQRLRDNHGLDLEPSRQTLRRLQAGEMDLGGREAAVATMLAPRLLAYNDTWDKLDAMLEEITSPAYRDRLSDSFGGGWIFNWFCLDHVGYEQNPRRRDMGFHNIFDHYRQFLRDSQSDRDGLHFHYHPMPFSRQGHHSATHYFAHCDSLYQVLCRRIIDRGWFPSCNRPGFHVTRPDSHWFLEQFIPFDFANQALDQDDESQPDLAAGRFGDWRRAPRHWQPYHPRHDDYQTPGGCRRWILRCLNVGTRLRLLRQEDVDQAFEQAAQGLPVVLAITNHDFRDMRPDLEGMHEMLTRAARRHEGVKFRYCEARQAARLALGLEERPPLVLEASLRGNLLEVSSDAPIFGPQPFLALKTLTGAYYHDNLDFQEPGRRWSYTLDSQTLERQALEAVGLAACDHTGNVTVLKIDCPTGRQELRHC